MTHRGDYQLVAVVAQRSNADPDSLQLRHALPTFEEAHSEAARLSLLLTPEQVEHVSYLVMPVRFFPNGRGEVKEVPDRSANELPPGAQLFVASPNCQKVFSDHGPLSLCIGEIEYKDTGTSIDVTIEVSFDHHLRMRIAYSDVSTFALKSHTDVEGTNTSDVTPNPRGVSHALATRDNTLTIVCADFVAELRDSTSKPTPTQK